MYFRLYQQKGLCKGIYPWNEATTCKWLFSLGISSLFRLKYSLFPKELEDLLFYNLKLYFDDFREGGVLVKFFLVYTTSSLEPFIL